jgi:hypothetical protein
VVTFGFSERQDFRRIFAGKNEASLLSGGDYAVTYGFAAIIRFFAGKVK